MRLQVDALEELPDQVERSILLGPNVDDPGDVLGLQLAERAGFAPKTLDFLVVPVAGKQDLDDNSLIELRVESLDQQAVFAAEDGANAVFSSDQVAGMDLVGAHAWGRS